MSRRKTDDRPRIWADGRQHPRFEFRAFALASVHFAREGLSGLLTRCAASARGLGAQLAEGRWRLPPHRLGRSGRLLPSHRHLGGAVAGFAGVLAHAAATVAGETPQGEASLFRDRAPASPPPAPGRPAGEPAPVAPLERPRRPAPGAAPVAAPLRTAAAAPSLAPAEPDLDAIRAIIRQAGTPEPAAPSPAAPAPATATPATATTGAEIPAAVRGEGWRLALLRDMAATALGFGLLVVSVPYGLFCAILAHLNGEDLRRRA